MRAFAPARYSYRNCPSQRKQKTVAGGQREGAWPPRGGAPIIGGVRKTLPRRESFITNNHFSRRDFFKLGALVAAGAAAAGLAGCAPAADKAAAGSDAAGAADASAEGAVSTNDVVIKLGDTLPKWSFMVPPAPIPEDEITETIENDIIVVGAGMSGLTTAVAAAEQGGKVTLFSASSAPISRGGSNFAQIGRAHV